MATSRPIRARPRCRPLEQTPRSYVGTPRTTWSSTLFAASAVAERRASGAVPRLRIVTWPRFSTRRIRSGQGPPNPRGLEPDRLARGGRALREQGADVVDHVVHRRPEG